MGKISDQIISRIQKREATVAVIGLGYVGLPLVIRFCEERFSVLGFDVDADKVEKLNQGFSYIQHIPSEKVRAMVDSGHFQATSDFNRLGDADAVVVCVPTPLNPRKEPDMRFIHATTRELARGLRRGQLISLESTTYPGTTREILLPAFEGRGLSVDEDFLLAFSPEREDPGNPRFSTKDIPKVVGGISPDSTRAAAALYDSIVDRVVPVSSTEAAEFTKLLENIFRAVNIALVNEMKILTHRMKVDIWEIIEASSTKPFGFMPFYPGPGLGGHCIPIDPYYLSWKAREFDFNTRFIELAGEVNTGMPLYVVDKLSEALNRNRKCLNGSRILILGVAYKADTDDIRESPALRIMEILRDRGAEIFYHDPFIPRIPKMRAYDFDLKNLPLEADELRSMDAAVIVTGHSEVDYGRVVDLCPLTVDTRNKTGGLDRSLSGKIVKA